MNIRAVRQLSGENGGIKLATGVNNGNWMQIYALTASSFSGSVSNIVGLTNFDLVAGQSLPGVFTQVTLTTGTAIGYNRRA
jgi:hypothetical protein